MRVRIILYSILRDMHGDREVIVESNRGDSVGDLVDKAIESSRGLAEAVAIVGRDNLLILDSRGRRVEINDPVDDNTYHLMPPPEGGNVLVRTGILARGEKVSLEELVREASTTSNSLGGVAVFIGVVREENYSKRVEALIYEDAGKITEEKLERIAKDIAVKHGLTYVAAYHYTGKLRPGDTTMIVVVGGRGRSEVFPALAELVENIKTNLPIWKKEVYSDGSYSYILGGKPYYPKNRGT